MIRRIYLCICKLPKIWRLSIQYPYTFFELWKIWCQTVMDMEEGFSDPAYEWNTFRIVTGELDW